MILEYDFGDFCQLYEFEISSEQLHEALAEIIAGYYDKQNNKEKFHENRKFIKKLFEDGFMADDEWLARQYIDEIKEYFKDIAREEYDDGKATEENDKYYLNYWRRNR